LNFSNSRKEVCGYAKVKVLKKWTSVQIKLKKRKKEEDSPYSSKSFQVPNKRDMFSKSIVELG
jgi:hypothetical protein